MKIKPIKLQDNLHRYVISFSTNSFNLPLFITSDWHFDNPKTDRKAIFSHLDEVKERNGIAIINGDLLCLMQGKYDPRKSKSAIRPEHNGDAYIDLVIEDTARKLVPYAKNILQINLGNHETAVSNRQETNILGRLVDRLNHLAGTNIQLGAYMGMIIICFDKNGGTRKTYNIAYSHGHWGGVVSKGTQASMRYGQLFPNADLVCSGHTHDAWHMTLQRYVYSPSKGTLEIKNQDHIKTGTYKEEFQGGKGWAVEKIGLPKATRASYWVELFFHRDKALSRRISTVLENI